MGDEIEIVKAQFDRIESEGGSPEPDFDDSALMALERYLRKDRVRDLPNELKSLLARRIADLEVWTVVGGRVLDRSDDDRHPCWRTMLRNGTTEER